MAEAVDSSNTDIQKSFWYADFLPKKHFIFNFKNSCADFVESFQYSFNIKFKRKAFIWNWDVL